MQLFRDRRGGHAAMVIEMDQALDEQDLGWLRRLNGVYGAIFIEGPPKSQKSIRSIPIPSFLLEVLQKYKANEMAYLLTGTIRYIEPVSYTHLFLLRRCLN